MRIYPIFLLVFFTACQVVEPVTWVSYTNEDMGISLQYPDECVLEEYDPELFGFYYPTEIEFVRGFTLGKCDVRVQLYTKPVDFTIKEWEEEYSRTNSSEAGCLGEMNSTEFLGHEANFCSFGCCALYRRAYFIERDDLVYLFVIGGNTMLFPGDEDDSYEHYQEIVDSIEMN